MTEDAQHIANIVDDLNGAWFEKTRNTEINPFIFETNGEWQCVEFFGQPIWTSEEDVREWDESENNLEPLKGFLARKANELLALLKSVTF